MNKQYQEYLKSDHWRNLRSKKFAGSRVCGICRGRSELQVHHLFYKNLYDCDTTDLRVLCKRCHFFAHDLMREGRLVFKIGGSHHHRWEKLKYAVIKELGLAEEIQKKNREYKERKRQYIKSYRFSESLDKDFERVINNNKSS